MDTGFSEILRRYGEAVTLTGIDSRPKRAKALVRPLPDRGAAQNSPTPLGLLSRDRYLYLGEPDVSLESDRPVAVQYRNVQYRVRQARPIYLGGTRSHWWAILEVDEG